MEFSKFAQQVESAMDGVPPGSLAPDTVFRQLAQWDSLSALNLISMANAEYGVDLTAADLQACKTVKDLFAKIQSKTA